MAGLSSSERLIMEGDNFQNYGGKDQCIHMYCTRVFFFPMCSNCIYFTFLIYIFRCTVTTKLEPDGKVITASANADVTIVVNAPQITDHSPNQIVFAGNDVFLFCKAQGIPKPEIFWSEPKYVSNSASKLQGNDFVIRNAILSDNGQYNCTAINSVGNTT